jgi:hypothetical protein
MCDEAKERETKEMEAKEQAKYVLKYYTDLGNYENELLWKKISAMMAIGAALVAFIIAGINYDFNKVLMIAGLGVGFVFSFGLWYTSRRENEQIKYLETKVSEWSKIAVGEDVLDIPANHKRGVLTFRSNIREYTPFTFIVISLLMVVGVLYEKYPDSFPKDVTFLWGPALVILLLVIFGVFCWEGYRLVTA